MTSYARLTEAFNNDEYNSHKYSKSSDSSDSIRLNNHHNNDNHSNEYRNNKYRNNEYCNNEYPTNYTVDNNQHNQFIGHKLSNKVKLPYTYESNLNYNNENPNNFNYENDCMYLINQVLSNPQCMRILKNILLDEYLDDVIRKKVDNYSKQSERKTVEGFEDYNTTIFGFDLKTIILTLIIVIVIMYMFDIILKIIGKK